MSFLTDLSPEKREMLASLPYRVGVWVSQSDSVGGSESEAQEEQALSNILHAYAEEIFGSETVQHIISATIARKDEWPKWRQNMGEVIVDCRYALDILAEASVEKKEISAFRQHLMEIGEAVALAFREGGDDEMNFMERVEILIAFLRARMRAMKAGQPHKAYSEFVNISPGERRALQTLAEALKTQYI